MNNTVQYVAFLRGINVGGNAQVKMEDLRQTFEDLGFENVKSLLNSGNVIFSVEKSQTENLKEDIEKMLEKTFEFKISILLRSISEIKALIDSEPFIGIKVTPETRLYVTFLSEKPSSSLKIPYESPEKDMKILSVNDTEVCSGVIISPTKNTTDLMTLIEKEFGKNVTTRNWNTINRVYKLSKITV